MIPPYPFIYPITEGRGNMKVSGGGGQGGGGGRGRGGGVAAGTIYVKVGVAAARNSRCRIIVTVANLCVLAVDGRNSHLERVAYFWAW